MASQFNPSNGIKDFWEEFRKPNPYRWPILAVSTLPMLGIIVWANGETVIAPPAPPQVSFITTFAEGRTDEEIRASNIENQRIQDARRAEQAERDEQVRDLYRELGRATGLDVDAMEAKIKADRAREETAQAAQAEETQIAADPAE